MAIIICLLVIKTLQTMQVWRKTLCSHVLCYMYTKYVDTSVQRNNIFNTKLLFTEWKQNANVSLKTLNADCWLMTFIQNVYNYLIMKKNVFTFPYSAFVKIYLTWNSLSKWKCCFQFFSTLQPLAWDVCNVCVCFRS